MQSIDDAQQDMRAAYYSGATGAVSSATAWTVAAIITYILGPTAGVVALLIGGMMIFPASVLLSKALGRSGSHGKNNPLAPLAIEGTVWMMFGILIAVGVASLRLDWFFPAMLLTIGGRYLSFATLYGMRIYWVFGATLAVSALALVLLDASASYGAFTGATIEYGFAAAIFLADKRDPA